MEWDEAADLNSAIRAVAMRHRAMATTALARLGLSPGQEVVLFDLAEKGPRTQIQLAATAGCEPPTMTAAVRKLQGLGLVTRSRCRSDARAVVVDLTDKGRRLVPQLQQAWIELADATLAGVPEGTATTLRSALRHLADQLRGADSSRPCH